MSIPDASATASLVVLTVLSMVVPTLVGAFLLSRGRRARRHAQIQHLQWVSNGGDEGAGQPSNPSGQAWGSGTPLRQPDVPVPMPPTVQAVGRGRRIAGVALLALGATVILSRLATLGQSL